MTIKAKDWLFDEEGLVIVFDKSKNNQFGEAEEKAVFYAPDPATCPIRALQAWLRVLDRATGPVFGSLRKGQRLTTRRLTDQYLNRIAQQYLGATFASHSLRASFVTVAKLNRADDSEIMNQT